MLEIIGRRHPDCVADRQALRTALQGFYPWHSPEVVHEHLHDPDDWWAALQPGLAAAAVAAGLDPRDAATVAAEVRSCYPVVETFRLYDDTTEALRMFRDAGWRQAIVSNHCPELESIVDGLGIGAFLDKVYSSACTGYEKPHLRAIGLALEYFEVDVAWMIGNSLKADVGAADAAVHSVGARRPGPAGSARRGGDTRAQFELNSGRSDDRAHLPTRIGPPKRRSDLH